MGHLTKWKLVYPDGSEMEEPADDASIRLARPGAAVLVLVERQPQGPSRPFVKVNLFDEETPWRPIFYRVRGLTSFGRSIVAGSLGTDAIVFGRGRESSDVHCDAQLFYWAKGMRAAGPCPAKYIDQAMCQLQVLEPEPGPLER